MQLHYLGKEKYDLMEEDQVEEIYRLIIEEESQEFQFENCICDLFSYLESDYFENENELR